MMSFWKHKSDKPLVRGYSGWYYNIEYYGITRTFIDIKQLQLCRNQIVERTERWGQYSHPIWSRCGFSMRMHSLRMRYIHFRHREEVLNLYDRAYMQFHSESDNEEQLTHD